jgi:hypothetical protein
VNTIEFDVNFLNFEDPDVLARMTGPDYARYWKESYGVDYVAKLPGETIVNGNNTRGVFNDETPMAKHCVKSEFRYCYHDLVFLEITLSAVPETSLLANRSETSLSASCS